MKMLVLILVAISSISSALAFPLAPVDDINFRPAQFKSLLNQNYDFEGIVKLSNCSASIVKLEGMSNDNKAWVMTNGHCVPRGIFGGFLKPGEVIVNKSVNTRMRVFKNKNTLFNINAVKILYATMTNTDIAFYELDESYAQILSRTGILPLNLSSQRPVVGTPIEIVSGYWERGYSCGIDAFVYSLREGDWTFTDSIRYTDGCNTIGGTSGSPILAAGSRDVIGVNNTANESGKRCTQNNPCEVDERGDVVVRRGVKYGQQSYNVYSCLNDKFQFSLNMQGCSLPK